MSLHDPQTQAGSVDHCHYLHRSFRIPSAFVALREFLLDGFDPPTVGDYAYEVSCRNQHIWKKCQSFFCGDIDIDVFGLALDTVSEPAGELYYDNQPIEFVPFGWNGGDGLQYGWAVLAPELDLDDQLCVSFAPVDEHAVWLGDNTKQALENLLVGEVAGWEEWSRQEGKPSPADDPRWTVLCHALGLNPEIGSPHITAGARSTRMIRPMVPPGWRYEPMGDGIGVLAEATAFAPGALKLEPEWYEEEHIAEAQRLLTEGYPASALCVLKATYPEREVMQTMREAYRALGRMMHVERADLWLRYHPSSS